MSLINEISRYIIMLSVAYAVVVIPKAISEYRGLQKTESNPVIGTPAPNEIWRHGINEWILIGTVIIILPIEIYIEEYLRIHFGMVFAAIFTLIIAVVCHIYASKKGKENQSIIDAMSPEKRYRNPELELNKKS